MQRVVFYATRSRLAWARAAFSLLTVSALLVVAPTPAGAAPPDTFTFVGSGFGHGVGMSQWGAYGQALEGRTATQILQHYYSGTTVSPVDDSMPIRVNLLEDAPTAQARGEALSPGGGSIRVVAGAATLDAAPSDVVSFSVAGTMVSVSRQGASPVAADVVRVQWAESSTVVNFIGSGESFDSANHRYRYGEVDLAVVDGALQVVNTLNLHGGYLRGINEVPSSWPTEALNAQVIAARTFALRSVREGERPECRCHVVDTVADQVFSGWSKESEPTFGARWVAAVDATSPSAETGLVVLHSGAPISANYFSSSGGRTESNVDGFGSTSAVPYLKSVDDRWSLASHNPFSSWTFTRTQAAVREAFNRDLPPDRQLADVERIDLGSRTPGGSVRSAVAVASDGKRVTLSGSAFRQRLELPARWVGTPVVRVSGNTRYATSVASGKIASNRTEGTVLIASGETAHLVDGLVAAPLARLRQAPLLLSTADALPAVVGDEVARRKATTAILIGGLGALSEDIEQDLRSRGVTTVRRLAGATRYETGLAVAREIGAPRSLAVIASGESGHLVDALAVGGPAAGTARPILLVSRDEVPFPTRQALTELGVTATVVAGGPAAVSDATMAQLPSPRRLSGPDRYATAVAVADEFAAPLGVGLVTIASGADGNLVDALPGGAIGVVTLLTPPGSLAPAARGWLERRGEVGVVDVLGGPAAVSNAAFDEIRGVVYP